MLGFSFERFHVLLGAVEAAIHLTLDGRSAAAFSSRLAGRLTLATSQPAPVIHGLSPHSLSDPSPTDHYMVFPGTLSHSRAGGHLYPHTGSEIRPMAITGYLLPLGNTAGDSPHQLRFPARAGKNYRQPVSASASSFLLCENSLEPIT